MTGNYPDTGPPERESRPVGSGPAQQLSTPIKNTVSVASQTHAFPPPPIPTVEGYLASLGQVPVMATCAGCKHGTAFEDGRRLCWKHQTPNDRATLDELNRRGRAIGVPPDRHNLLEGARAWPYVARVDVATRRAMVEWAETNGLSYVDRSHACEAWLTGSRCPGIRRCAGLSRVILRRLDHASSWIGPKGLRLVVAQPYSLDAQDADELRGLAAVDGLHITVQPPGSGWYGQTYTVLAAGFPDAEAAA